MPPTAKEKEISAARLDTAQGPAPNSTLPGDTAVKQQPVALEVPVTVNGARTVEGSDKREPFSETTKTVLIFGNGTVIRLSSSVAPGQLVFLTNEKTKREVVCQVVKSKNYRNVSGYVELEFTESVVGFWGMRFPGDRISSAPQPGALAPASSSSASDSPAIPHPVALNVAAPAASVTPSVAAATPAVPVSLEKEREPKFSEAKSVIPTAPVGQILPARVAPVIPIVPAAPVSATRELTVNSAAANPVPPAFTLFDSPRISEVQASFLEPLEAPPAHPTVNTANSPAVLEAKPAVHPPQAEALKPHTASLQEQLSSKLFTATPAAPPVVAVQIPQRPPVAKQKELADSAAKVSEMSRTHVPEPAPAKPVAPMKLDPLPTNPARDEEVLKIPAWLEPLARNAAAPTSNEELIEREKRKRLAEQPKVEETAGETVAGIEFEEDHLAQLPLQTLDDPLPADDESSLEESSIISNRGMLIGAIAAGVLLLAGGGWWYMRAPSAGANAGPAPASNVHTSAVSPPGESSPSQTKGNAPLPTNPPGASNPLALTNTAAQSNSSTNPLSVVPPVASAATTHNTQPPSNPAKGGASATSSAAAQPAAEQLKKPILGNVHLATPKVTASRNSLGGGEADAGIALNNVAPPEPGAEALNTGLVGDKQPSAPATALPVGGDVKLAKIIFSVPPKYPTLAKSQHVSGNVLIDALIDASGHVTTMKVVSGPVVLHQAAMDALKQWRYQPASLDGHPVPMHLAVTIQFRLR
jgi:TonB family protein